MREFNRLGAVLFSSKDLKSLRYGSRAVSMHFEDCDRPAENMRRWMAQVMSLLILLGGASNWSAAYAAVQNNNATSAPKVFVRLPPGMFSHAISTDSSCSMDEVNGNFARGAALDHLGLAMFSGWIGDKATGKVPAKLWLVLDGPKDFYIKASTGGSRPDVAAALHDPAFARSGFAVRAYMIGVPIGDYRATIYYRIGGKVMMCPTNATMSVQ